MLEAVSRTVEEPDQPRMHESQVILDVPLSRDSASV